VAAGLQPAESGLQADRPQRDVKAIRIWAGYKPAPTGQLEPRANWNHGPTGTTGQLEPQANWNHRPTGTQRLNWNPRPPQRSREAAAAKPRRLVCQRPAQLHSARTRSPGSATAGRRAGKPAGARDGPAGLKLEAAGVEPASRDVSIRTSTCVSGRFESRPRDPGRQGSSRTSPERI
jgi:hypothetical protein